MKVEFPFDELERFHIKARKQLESLKGGIRMLENTKDTGRFEKTLSNSSISARKTCLCTWMTSSTPYSR